MMNQSGCLLSGVLRLIAAVAVTLLTGTLAATAADSTGNLPKLAVESKVYDCKEIWSGEPLRHVFVLGNKGTGDLEVQRISPGCGVFVIRYDKRISPGQTGEIVLEVDTKRLDGEISKKTQVFTNDPEIPELDLEFKGLAKTSILVSPEARIKFEAQKGEILSWRFNIQSPQKKDFKITRVASLRGSVNSEYHLLKNGNGSGTGHVYELQLTLSPDAPLGRIRDLVKIYTDLPGGNMAQIGITGIVKGLIRYSPDTITFTPLADAGPISRTVDFYAGGQNKFGITGVKADHAELELEIIPMKKSGGYVLAAIWTSRDVKQILKGNIMVFTDNESQSRINIPYAVFPNIKKKTAPDFHVGKRPVDQ